MLYFNISALTLAITSTIAYLLIKLVCRFLNRYRGERLTRQIEIFLKQKKVRLTALIDTGNRLCDLFSGLPVIVVSFESVRSLIPTSLQNYFSTGVPPDINQMQTEEIRMIRMIPVKTIAGEQLLPSFLPDKVVINGEEKRAVLAVSQHMLSEGSYEAILNPLLT